MVWPKQQVGIDMRQIQATEAKMCLAELHREVEHGETVAITRHVKAVAHLVPAPAQDRYNRSSQA